MRKEALERARRWATDERFDAETREAASRLLEDEAALDGAFSGELAFGTGGLRGILGVGTARMNRYVVARATQGLADYLKANGGRRVAIGYDSRLGSDAFAREAAGVLAQNGLVAYVWPRLMPTPMLSFAVRKLGCDAGIVITASHNPAQYNGYKVYGPDGCQITEEAAAAITECINRVPYGGPTAMTVEKARALGLYRDIGQEVFDAFIERTLSCRAAPLARTPVRVVYTPLHGTGLEPVRAVLSRMAGVEVVEVEAQCTPDGHFPTCPKPNPELREALKLGLQTAREAGADLLIATDPDSDRVGVAVRTANGDYKVLTGNETGLLLMEFILSARRENGTFPDRAVVIKTIVTSDLAFAIAKRWGATVTECLTGFKYIGESIGQLEKAGEASRYVFGFEESCGYLAGTHVRDKDGVMACMLVTEMAQCAAANGCTLAEELQRLYARYGWMENRLITVEIAGAVPMEHMREAMARLRAQPIAELAGSAVAVVKDYLRGVDGLPASNVLSYATADGRKAIVRPSGTEPKVKAYLSAQGESEEQVRGILDTMEAQLRGRMGMDASR